MYCRMSRRRIISHLVTLVVPVISLIIIHASNHTAFLNWKDDTMKQASAVTPFTYNSIAMTSWTQRRGALQGIKISSRGNITDAEWLRILKQHTLPHNINLPKSSAIPLKIKSYFEPEYEYCTQGTFKQVDKNKTPIGVCQNKIFCPITMSSRYTTTMKLQEKRSLLMGAMKSDNLEVWLRASVQNVK